MSDPASVIHVDHVSKDYPLWASPSARLSAPLWGRLGRQAGLPAAARAACQRREAALVRHFHALKDVSFSLARGESLGIIGRNGAGKSTLLQIIAGTLAPSAGQVSVRGRVTALLELGSSLHGEFNGRENIALACAVYGIPPAQVARKVEEILAFAEIGEFIDQPVKTYSSGMALRLAFSVQTALDPDVLIVDEALAVGDIFFQAKCIRLLQERLARGLSLLFVSHDPGSIKALCRRALVLHRGEAVFLGESPQAVSVYEELVQSESRPVAPPVAVLAAGASAGADGEDILAGAVTAAGFPPVESLTRNWSSADEVGSREAAIVHARAVGVEDGRERGSFLVGEAIRLEFYFRAHADLDRPVLGFQLADRFGHVVYGLCSSQVGDEAILPRAPAGSLGRYAVELPGRLGNGDYLVDVTIGLGDRGDGAVVHHLHRVGGILALNVRHPGLRVAFFGPADLRATITHGLAVADGPMASSDLGTAGELAGVGRPD